MQSSVVEQIVGPALTVLAMFLIAGTNTRRSSRRIALVVGTLALVWLAVHLIRGASVR